MAPLQTSCRFADGVPFQSGLGPSGKHLAVQPIASYQPAQKWLNDLKGRTLTFDDVRLYQRILKILSETDRIMQTITITLDATSP